MSVFRRIVIPPPPMVPGVDTGRPCPRYWDGSIKRYSVGMGVRRELARRYGCAPGRTVIATCQYCPATGFIMWPDLASGKAGSTVFFVQLTMDHVHPYSRGGAHYDAQNYVLACKRCNSSKNASVAWVRRVA